MTKMDIESLTIKILGDYTELSYAMRERIALRIRDDMKYLKAEGRWKDGD